jgi:hypothetical protein
MVGDQRVSPDDIADEDATIGLRDPPFAANAASWRSKVEQAVRLLNTDTAGARALLLSVLSSAEE